MVGVEMGHEHATHHRPGELPPEARVHRQPGAPQLGVHPLAGVDEVHRVADDHGVGEAAPRGLGVRAAAGAERDDPVGGVGASWRAATGQHLAPIGHGCRRERFGTAKSVGRLAHRSRTIAVGREIRCSCVPVCGTPHPPDRDARFRRLAVRRTRPEDTVGCHTGMRIAAVTDEGDDVVRAGAARLRSGRRASSICTGARTCRWFGSPIS